MSYFEQNQIITAYNYRTQNNQFNSYGNSPYADNSFHSSHRYLETIEPMKLEPVRCTFDPPKFQNDYLNSPLDRLDSIYKFKLPEF